MPVVAWLLLQVADLMIDNIGAPDWLFRAILLVLALGFPLALIFAWAFEMTPEGIKRDHEVDRSQSITHSHRAPAGPQHHDCHGRGAGLVRLGQVGGNAGLHASELLRKSTGSRRR